MNTTRTGNYKAAHFIANLLDFQGSNLRGRMEGDEVYRIYSYWTVMAEIYPHIGEAWVNPRKYSRTTSKHMGYIMQGINQNPKVQKVV